MEPIIHYLIPIVFLLLLFPKTNKKLAFSLAALVWIIDLDFFTPFHRQLTHNLFFLIIMSAIFYFTINKKAMYLSAYFIGSHLILDSTYPGNALFWPLYSKAFYITTEITSKFLLNFKLGITDLALREPTTSYYLATEGLLFLALIGILLLAKYKNKILKQ